MVKERAPPKGPLRPIDLNEDAQPVAHRPEKHRPQELDPDSLTDQFDSLQVSDSSRETQHPHRANTAARRTDLSDVLSSLATQKPRQPTTALEQPKSAQRYSDDDDLASFFSNIGRRDDPFHSSSSSHPGSGHHPKVMSSRKQKAAGVFNERKSRPEHHRDYRISVPAVPVYQDRKPEPANLFSSIAPDARPATYRPKVEMGEPEFYTDPAKASADLKALLEGGLDEDEEDHNEGTGKDEDEKKKDPIQKDGSVEGLKVKLLPHQVEGVEWMRGRELGPVKKGRVPKGGILADDMGLGKTLQTIALILRNRKPNKDEEGWKEPFSRIEKTTLVVAPLALIRQWEAEIKDKVARSHGLKVCVHHGPQRTKRFKDLALYDVVVTTYQVLVSEYGQSSDTEHGLKAGCFGLHWWRVVLDEAHTIKNRNAKSTKACYALRSEYRWCLSGTPMQNSLEELQSLIRFLRIRPFDNLAEWKEQIEKPIKSGKGHSAIRQLHSLLRCFMKRRTKDILKADGALNPGGKPNEEGKETSSTGFRVTERKVVTVSAAFSPAERRFYDRLEARADESIERMMQRGMNYANALVLLLRLRQACNHPKLVEGKLDKDRDALSGEASQKALDAEMDSLADMFGGMGIVAKTCSICGRGLSVALAKSDQDICEECYGDLAYFNENETVKRKKPKHNKAGKIKEKKVVKKVTVEEEEEGASPHGNKQQQQQQQRRIRNRNAVIDSDDEGDEGCWLVPEDQRGQLRLGKAGGEEDENAEGGGEWLGNEDSLHPSEQGGDDDGSQLDSFVVADESVKEEEEKAYESDDTFPSLTELPARKSEAPRRSLSEGETSSSASEDDDDDDDDEDEDTGIDESEVYSDADSYHHRYQHGQPSQILASAKIRQMMQILRKEADEHKFIIFSQFTSMMDLVEPFLRKGGFKFTRYDGKMKNDEREASLHRLRNDKKTRILLCSLKCGSLGLNLTAATRVIIVEPFWNPFIEEQAIDRVHRLTQTIDVIVYKLTVEKTVEERILELQEKKRLLAQTAIEGGSKKDFLKLGFDEIMDLFRRGTRPAEPASQGRRELAGTSTSTAVPAPSSSSSSLGPAIKKKGPRTEDGIYGRRW
ncbi:hypothetical protein SODALDRAFT_268849 [Sodiomyces alkalinus F11]|uniref:Uncharacterized protein n=1 Tax=Sodiomyces alkalinus (strain CBS 110278 / VKM F-3762 / F11) TaxID=1314773 RepID=A0A3N2Q9D7_SODAK|nr:hypothetical protein SODALDRAFT_268849 [Sodiomyces alkalinus F11]ROT43317.1 hypothetical protein SODALDRAFT_268849 [Sodiomyces alkalinus F11]